MSSSAAFCTRMMPLPLWLPPARHKSPSWESFDTPTLSHPSHVSGMPISFSSDKTGWRALAQRTSLRVALDNPLNWWQINSKRKRKWKERSQKPRFGLMTFAVKLKPSHLSSCKISNRSCRGYKLSHGTEGRKHREQKRWTVKLPLQIQGLI